VPNVGAFVAAAFGVACLRFWRQASLPSGPVAFFWPRGRAPPSASIGFCEDAVALQVDDLLRFRDRKRNRIFPPLVRIGADESVFLHTFRSVFLDDPGSLIDAVVPIRGRADSVALVFHSRRRRFLAPTKGPPGEAAPCRFEL